MKQFFTFFMMMLPFVSFAQNDYLSLLEEGKKWHYTYCNWATGQTYQFVEYLSGDTIVGEKTYIKNCQQDGQVLNLLREEDGKVYEYNCRQKNERLLYDFTLCTGDTVETWSEREGMVVTDITEISTGGISRKGMALCHYCDESIEDDRPDFWIEGMGSHGGLMNTFLNQMAGNFVRLDYIEMPDGTTFSFYEAASVPLAQRADVAEKGIYDLQGRRVSEKGKVNGEQLPRGIYIQNGRKFVVK